MSMSENLLYIFPFDAGYKIKSKDEFKRTVMEHNERTKLSKVVQEDDYFLGAYYEGGHRHLVVAKKNDSLVLDGMVSFWALRKYKRPPFKSAMLNILKDLFDSDELDALLCAMHDLDNCEVSRYELTATTASLGDYQLRRHRVIYYTTSKVYMLGATPVPGTGVPWVAELETVLHTLFEEFHGERYLYCRWGADSKLQTTIIGLPKPRYEDSLSGRMRHWIYPVIMW